MNRNPRRAQLSAKVRAILATIVMVLGLGVSTAVMATPASADTGGYPNADMPCEHAPYSTTGTCANYDWGPTHDGSAASTYSSRGYGYRNCTDWVAWRLSGLSVPSGKYSGLGNAKQWPTSVSGVTVNTTPAKGAAAVSTSGDYGHVAFVESVSGSNITVSEYNKAGTGVYGTRTGTAAGLGFSKFIHFEAFETWPTGGGTTPPANPAYSNLLLARQGGNLFGKADLTDAWTALASNATGGMWASGNRIAYLSSGTLYAKNGLGGAWMNESSNVDEVALSNDLLVIRKGTTIYAKGALDSAWVTIATVAIDVKVAGTKILYRNAAHTLFSNDGMYGPWYNEGSNVDQFDASGNLLVKRVGSYAYAKYNLGDAWTEVSDVAADVQVGGTRIAVVSTADHHVWAKNWINGAWMNEEDAGDEYVITPLVLLIRQGSTVIAKSALDDAWVTLATTSTNVEASGSRIAVVNSSGDLAARNDLPTGWYNVLDSVTEFTVGT